MDEQAAFIPLKGAKIEIEDPGPTVCGVAEGPPPYVGGYEARLHLPNGDRAFNVTALDEAFLA
jgi:hypothetical protein